MINNKKVSKNFSKGAKTYDKSALIQKHMSDKLDIFVDGSKKEYRILEIGCGTGVFSEKLLKRFPKAKMDLLDISEEMIEQAKLKLGERENLNYIVEDIEEYSPEFEYDLIFSNATFQWIDDQERLFDHLNTMLDYGGKIVFSTFGKRTYCELKESYEMLGGDFCFSQDFVSRKALREIVGERFLVMAADEEKIVESYGSVIEFLKMIKNIGANSANESRGILTRGKLKELEEIYMSRYGDGSKIDVTNHLIYMVLEKRH